MSNQRNRWALAGVMVLTLATVACSLPAAAEQAPILDLRPIVRAPEPLTNLNPQLAWLKNEKVRGTWIGNEFYEKFENGDRTMAQVLKDAGFNVIVLSMTVNTNGQPTPDLNAPYSLKHDRTRSTAVEERLPLNLKEARRVGVKLMAVWQYGTSHSEPYRHYRNSKGELAKLTCCPLDEKYITGQHIGKWAVALAKGGADGMILDMEMYQSDTAWPEGACMCDDCFAKYLKAFAKDWKSIYDEVTPESRGKWLVEQKADAHYTDYTCKRMEAMYDSIRARCQKINPTFFFGVAGQLYHMPGLYHRGAPVERGLGTSSVPCLVFAEHEYPIGPYRGSYLAMEWIADGLPALYLPGAYIRKQPPQMMAESAIRASLYCDGWWVWYGTALLTNTKAEENDETNDYGRFPGTSAQEYLDVIKAANARIDKLLVSPKSQWPEQIDGKMVWLEKRVKDAEAEAAKANTPEAAKTLEEARTDLANYIEVVKQGGS